MRKAIGKVATSNIKPYIAWLFLLGIALSVLLYGYFLERMVFEATNIKKTSAILNPLATKVNDLEVQYLSLKAKVTALKATELGFKEASGIHFISKKTLGKLSLQKEL